MNNENTIASQRYLTVAEEKQLFKTVNMFGDIYARRDAAWMLLLRHTGIRIGSMAGLTVGDASLALACKRLTLSNAICKGGNGYSVPTNKKALKALRDLLTIRVEMGYHAIPDDILVMARKHQPMSIRTYQSRIKLWREKAGLVIQITPHSFRHTFGHRIIERSTAVNPLRVAQVALNHANINNTAIYTRPNREQIEGDIAAIV